MSRKHLFPIVALLAAAAVAGLLALTRTTQLGATASQPTSAQLTAKARSLDRLEAALRRELAKKPGVSSTQQAALATASPRTVYVRAATQPQSDGHETEHGDDVHDSDRQEHGDHDD
jgi:hypothetical protein